MCVPRLQKSPTFLAKISKLLNILREFRAIFNKLSADGGRRTTIAVLPFYHGSGFWALCYCLLMGHHSVIMRKFQAPLMLSCIEEYKVGFLIHFEHFLRIFRTKIFKSFGKILGFIWLLHFLSFLNFIIFLSLSNSTKTF